MKIPETEEEIYQFVRSEHDEVSNLHHDLNNEYISHIAENLSQRRELLKYLATIAAGILGIAPTLFDNVKQVNFFYIGVSLLILVVIFITNYLRTILDLEGNQLGKQLHEYNSFLSLQMGRSRDFLRNANFSVAAFKEYLKSVKSVEEKIKDLPGITKKNEQVDGQNRVERMDYAGEVFVYFFIVGSVSLLISVTNLYITNCWTALFVLVLFVITFFFPPKIFIWIGLPIDWIKHIAKKMFSKKDD